MFRTLIASALLYAYGTPIFDGYRPAFLDKMFQGFHSGINLVVRDGKHALGAFDKERCMRYIDFYVARIEGELRTGFGKPAPSGSDPS